MNVSIARVLLRLNRKVGREAARYERMATDKAASAMSRERAYGEANVLRMVQGFIWDELRQQPKLAK